MRRRTSISGSPLSFPCVAAAAWMRGSWKRRSISTSRRVSLKDGSSIFRRVLSSSMTVLMRRRKNQRMPGASSRTPAAQAASRARIRNSHSGTLTVLAKCSSLHKNDVELLLSVARFGLQRNRLADEVRQHGKRLRFIVEKQIDDGRRRQHAVFAGIELARLAQEFAQDFIRH